MAYWVITWQELMTLCTGQDPVAGDKRLVLLDSFSIHCLLLVLQHDVRRPSNRCTSRQNLASILACRSRMVQTSQQ